MSRFGLIAVLGIALGLPTFAQMRLLPDDAVSERWTPRLREFGKWNAESYYPTRPNTGIRGRYVTRLNLGEFAGRSNVEVRCDFRFWDWNDGDLCGTGKVRFSAEIGGKTVFKSQTDRFDKSFCDTQASHRLDVDLSGYGAADTLVCTAKVVDRAKLPQSQSAGIRHTAGVDDYSWDTRHGVEAVQTDSVPR